MRRFVIAAVLATAMPTLAVASPTPATIRVDTTTHEVVRQVAVRSARSYTDTTGAPHALARNTVLGQLVALAVHEHFTVAIRTSQYGPGVYVIDGVGNPGTLGWSFAVNGAVPSSTADHVTVRPGDRVVWWYIQNFQTQSSVTPLDVLIASHHGPRLVFLVRRTIFNAASGVGVLKAAKGAVLTVNHHHYLVGGSGRVTVTLTKHAAFRAAATQTGAIASETLTGRV